MQLMNLQKKNIKLKLPNVIKFGLRNKPNNLIVIKIEKTGMPKIIYKGKGEPVWDFIKNKKAEQKFISIQQLEKIKENA